MSLPSVPSRITCLVTPSNANPLALAPPNSSKDSMISMISSFSSIAVIVLPNLLCPPTFRVDVVRLKFPSRASISKSDSWGPSSEATKLSPISFPVIVSLPEPKSMWSTYLEPTIRSSPAPPEMLSVEMTWPVIMRSAAISVEFGRKPAIRRSLPSPALIVTSSRL